MLKKAIELGTTEDIANANELLSNRNKIWLLEKHKIIIRVPPEENFSESESMKNEFLLTNNDHPSLRFVVNSKEVVLLDLSIKPILSWGSKPNNQSQIGNLNLRFLGDLDKLIIVYTQKLLEFIKKIN